MPQNFSGRSLHLLKSIPPCREEASRGIERSAPAKINELSLREKPLTQELSGMNTRRMHRSHSTCTFHRAWPLAGHDDPFFLRPLLPRRQPDVVDRSRSRPILRALSFLYPRDTRHSHCRNTDDPFTAGGKMAKVTKGHSSIE